MKEQLKLQISTNVKIHDVESGEIFLNKSNALHLQNLSRIIARALAHEENSNIYRIAFGNGGTFTDASSNIVFRPRNDGNNGDGWESRLYNETYSEIVDDSASELGTDPGSDNRVGGGALPLYDPSGEGVVSQEVGIKSQIIITTFLNENEPTTQSGTSFTTNKEFTFDEIGLYSFGKPPSATHGVSSVDVGIKKSTEQVLDAFMGTVLTLNATVDSVNYSTEITVPADGTGTGLAGKITYGDLCEGINSGDWVTSGDQINDYVYVYITDDSFGTYPSIVGKESFGYLIFESKSTGTSSNVTLSCEVNNTANFFNSLTGNVCGNVNANQKDGVNAGVQNDLINQLNERERLLTHIIFSPITKSADRIFQITYTITITLTPSQDSSVTVVQ